MGKRGTRSKGRPGLSDVFASPILPITYLSFSSISFFAGVCSAGKETGEQSSIRKKNRGQRKGVCEKVSFVAGGETDLQAAGQDTGEKHWGLRVPAWCCETLSHGRIALDRALGKGPGQYKPSPVHWNRRPISHKTIHPKTSLCFQLTSQMCFWIIPPGDAVLTGVGAGSLVLRGVRERVGLAALGRS